MNAFNWKFGAAALLAALWIGVIPTLQAQEEPDLGFAPGFPSGHLFGTPEKEQAPPQEEETTPTPKPTPSPLVVPPEPVAPESSLPEGEPFVPGFEIHPLPPKLKTAEPEPESPEPKRTLPFQKKMVLIPPLPSDIPLSADDFRDPFFLIRNKRESAQEVLKPGTTLDGIRFNSYADTHGFIENFYRDSNFLLNDVFGNINLVNKEGGCIACHRGIEEISKNHAFDCIDCHSGNPRGVTVQQAHTGMISNPSDLEHAPNTCGKCHAEQVEKVQGSLMANPRGIVEMTRYAWGHSKWNDSRDGQVPWTFQATDHRADDFLKKKCLRCHVQSAAPHRAGDYRGTGCAACHMIYTNDGLTLSRDRAIQKKQRADIRQRGSRFAYRYGSTPLENRRGYPLLHKFTVAVPSVQCEHCHNNNGVGSEYEGLFAKPARPEMSHADVLAEEPVLHGRRHEFLIPDIHREKGMHCIDCHGPEDVKAGAAQNPTMHSAVKIRCQTCHGVHGKEPEAYKLVEADPRAQALIKSNQLNPNLMTKVKIGDVVMADDSGNPMPHIKMEKEGWVLYSKVTGKPHVIPILDRLRPSPQAHRITEHLIKVECAACHARWSANEWGLHAIREPELDIAKWIGWSFGDPVLQQRFATPDFKMEPGPDEKQKPPEQSGDIGMLDWTRAIQKPERIEGAWSPGVWLNLVTESGWSEPILGVNRRGRVIVVQPRYQYFVTDLTQPPGSRHSAEVPITKDGKPGLVWTPHTPHTIRPSARECRSCHQNPVATGLGEPQLHKVENAGQFLKELKATNRVLPQFQIKQTVTPRGEAIQTVLPGADFLDRKLIDSLNRMTDRYRGWLFTDLRSRGLSRLLTREVFPYDDQHQLNEKKFGAPSGDEDLVLYYDLNKNEVKTERRVPPAGKPVQEPYGPGAGEWGIEPVTPPAEPKPEIQPKTNPFGVIPPPVE